jgi:hypothetical protein
MREVTPQIHTIKKLRSMKNFMLINLETYIKWTSFFKENAKTKKHNLNSFITSKEFEF